jgi:hypothetical protein
MKGMTRGIVILAVVLVALVIIARVTSQNRLATVEGGGFVELLPGFDRADLATVRAWVGTNPDSSVVLSRSGDGWVVASDYDWPAREENVKTLLDDLEGLSGELRSSDPAVLADYAIADSNSFHIAGEKSGGSELFHLVVGKNARGGGFVRQAGSNEVYLTSKGLRSSFGIWGDDPKPPQAQRWLDLQVVKLDRNDIDKIVLKNGKSTMVLEKEFEEPAAVSAAEGDSAAAPAGPDRTKWSWKPDKKGPFHKVKTDGVLNQVASLYATKAADPKKVDQYGLDPAERTVEITLHDGTVTRLLFGTADQEGQDVYFRKDSGPPALIHKTTVDRIFLDRKALLPSDEKT